MMSRNHDSKVKILCFYLPQYHPIPENDEWWGKGFTDWRNVVKAKPRFRGHYQPHIPADLGLYDLRLEETRIAQAELAKEHGISGFCYYHYWFNGKMLLDRPFYEVLHSGKPDFPFCLCWANENWTRAWDGLHDDVLLKQDYTKQDRIEHINWLCNAFRDLRYIKINGRPLLLIYRVDNISDLAERIQDWRTIVKEQGFHDLYLCAVRSNFSQLDEQETVKLGFDAIVEFQPHYRDLPNEYLWFALKAAVNVTLNKLISILHIERYIPLLNVNRVYRYKELAKKAMSNPHPTKYKKFPCASPSWDNSARKRVATIIQNDDPDAFAEWLRNALERVGKYSDDEKIVFINAWNEWAEGCYLEPDLKNGRSILEATRSALNTFLNDLE